MLNQPFSNRVMGTPRVLGVLIALITGLAGWSFAPPALAAPEQLPPPIAEYVFPADLADDPLDVFLEAVRKAVEAEPDRADEIAYAAVRFRASEIERTPAVATEIAIAVMEGLQAASEKGGGQLAADGKTVLEPDYKSGKSVVGMDPQRYAEIVRGVWFALARALSLFPVDIQAQVMPTLVGPMMAMLPPDVAKLVTTDVPVTPFGGLGNDPNFIYSTPPTTNPGEEEKPKDEEKPKEEEKPEDTTEPTQPEVTPVTPAPPPPPPSDGNGGGPA